MRIAYVISTLDQCGPVNVLFDIIEPLAPHHEVAVFTLASEPASSRKPDFERLGISVTCVTETRIDSLLHGRKKLAKALDAFGAEVVHAHGYRAYLLCSRLDLPTVATVHNCLYDDFLPEYGFLQAKWMTHSEVHALRRFDCVLACSASNAACLQKDYNLTVGSVRNGVNQRVYTALSTAEKREMRVKLGVSENVKTMLVFTGGCSERKRTLALIEWFKANYENDATYALYILGGGPLADQCRLAACDNVFLQGFCSDVVPWLQAADYFVSFSASEGMPLAVLEAISCGCFALLSDIPPHREIVECCQGRYARLLNPSEELPHGLDSQRSADGEFAAGLGKDVFGSRAMSEAYLAAYSQLLDACAIGGGRTL